MQYKHHEGRTALTVAVMLMLVSCASTDNAASVDLKSNPATAGPITLSIVGTVRGAMIFTSTSSYPVITQGNPPHADIMLTRLGRPTPCAQSQTETPQNLEAFGYGVWTIVGHQIPGISAMSNADANAWHGRILRLTANQAFSHESRCDAPVYKKDIVSKNQFLGQQFNLPPQSLPTLAGLEQITVMQVFCGSERWVSLGGLMIQIDKTRALAVWNGVFFELARNQIPAK